MESRRRSKIPRAKCIACGKVITGKPRVMKLKITSSRPELLESSKKLGFTSTSWQEEDFLQGFLHKKCFDMAIHIWAGGISHEAHQPETVIRRLTNRGVYLIEIQIAPATPIVNMHLITI